MTTGAPADVAGAVARAQHDEPDRVLALALQRMHQPGDLPAQVGHLRHPLVNESARHGR